jgi:hypothetical protein
MEGSVDLQRCVFITGYPSWYAYFGSGTTPILRDPPPLRRPSLIIGENCWQFSTVDRSHLSNYLRCRLFQMLEVF